MTAPGPSAPTRLVVVTPWFPTPERPYAGSFVRDAVAAVADRHPDPLVVHLDNVAPDAGREPERRRERGIDVLHVPVPVDPLASRPAMARAQRDALAAALPQEWHQAPVVHAHVGMPTGWAVTQLLPGGTRLLLTEHASYLNRIFTDPEAHAMYGEAVRRAAATLAVSERLAVGIRGAYPELADGVHTLPNPVDMARIPQRDVPPSRLSRWLYVGNLLEAKGVERVLSAFALRQRRTEDPDGSLVLAGDGPMREALRAQAADLGVADRVHLLGARPPADIPPLLLQADVLVHLSRSETFGLALVEAAASGLPVVSTMSGGPEVTLAEASAVGLARLVPLDADDEAVVAAVEELEAAVPNADARAVRAVLEWRYGAQRVGRRLADVYDGRPPTDGDDDGALRVLAIDLSTGARRAVQATVRSVLAAEGRAVVVTNDPARFAAMGARAHVIDVGGYERALPLNRTATALTITAPGHLLRGVAAGTRVLAALCASAGRPGRVGRAATDRLTARITTLRQRHVEAALRFRRGPYKRLYDQVGPWLVARHAVAGPLREVDLSQVDVVIAPDYRAVPLAWRLVAANPAVEVRGPLNRPQVGRLVAARATRRGAEPERRS